MNRIKWFIGYRGMYQLIWWWRRLKHKATDLDVDDWKRDLKVGDLVWYKFKKWEVVERFENYDSDEVRFKFKRFWSIIEVEGQN